MQVIEKKSKYKKMYDLVCKNPKCKHKNWAGGGVLYSSPNKLCPMCKQPMSIRH